MLGITPPLPHTSSWLGALLSTRYVMPFCSVKCRGNFTFTLPFPATFKTQLGTATDNFSSATGLTYKLAYTLPSSCGIS